MNVSMYEIALRKKLRFASTKGDLDLERLWDVPLRSKDDFNLDSVARAANKDVKSTAEESFVATRKTTKQTVAELRLDLIKHVIEVRLEEEDAARRRSDNVKKREKLLEALEKKQDSKLEGMSEAKIKAELAALDDD